MIQRLASLTLLVLALAPLSAAQELDPTQFVKAPPRVPFGESVQVGWSVTQSIESETANQTIHYAIVGETDDTWQVEHVSPAIAALADLIPAVKGCVMGLVVRKEDGVVVSAVLGHPDSPEPPREIGVSEMPPGAEPQSVPPGEPGEVELALGTFPCEVFNLGETTTCVGTEGELKGVLLKSSTGDSSYELEQPPVAGQMRLGDETLDTKAIRYSNGTRFLTCDDPVIEAFFPGSEGGMLEMRTPEFTVRVTGRSTDATPRLRW